MQTVRTEDQVKSEVQGVALGFCVEENDEDYDSYKSVDNMTEEETTKVAKRLKVSPEFLNEVNSTIRDLRDAAHTDLSQMWAKLQDK